MAQVPASTDAVVEAGFLLPSGAEQKVAEAQGTCCPPEA